MTAIIDILETFRQFGTSDGVARKALLAGCTVAAFIAVAECEAGAHTLPWQTGESRIKGVGTCAKGPCMKRYDFSESEPHHHEILDKCGVVDMRGRPLNVSEACHQTRQNR